jgi:hypothetical protein
MTRFKVGLAGAGLLAILASTVAYAGMWPGFPIVGFTSLCWGSSSTATGTYTGAQTGCPNTAPAGPASLPAATLIPADVYNPVTGTPGNPATILLSLASLNAMPILVSAANPNNQNFLSATNLQGGIILTAPAAISGLNVSLPPTPIDGQQYRISTTRSMGNLGVFAGTPATQSVSNAPTSLTVSTTAPMGYTFMWNASNSVWIRLE